MTACPQVPYPSTRMRPTPHEGAGRRSTRLGNGPGARPPHTAQVVGHHGPGRLKVRSGEQPGELALLARRRAVRLRSGARPRSHASPSSGSRQRLLELDGRRGQRLVAAGRRDVRRLDRQSVALGRVVVQNGLEVRGEVDEATARPFEPVEVGYPVVLGSRCRLAEARFARSPNGPVASTWSVAGRSAPRGPNVKSGWLPDALTSSIPSYSTYAGGPGPRVGAEPLPAPAIQRQGSPRIGQGDELTYTSCAR